MKRARSSAAFTHHVLGEGLPAAREAVAVLCLAGVGVAAQEHHGPAARPQRRSIVSGRGGAPAICTGPKLPPTCLTSCPRHRPGGAGRRCGSTARRTSGRRPLAAGSSSRRRSANRSSPAAGNGLQAGVQVWLQPAGPARKWAPSVGHFPPGQCGSPQIQEGRRARAVRPRAVRPPDPGPVAREG